MAKRDLREFKADHEGGDVVLGGEVPEPTDAAGGPIQPRLGDVKAAVDPEADELEVVAPGNAVVPVVKEDADVAEAFNSLFEGMDLSEDFKGKLSMVFEAAVNEAVSVAVEEKTSKIAEELEEQFKTQLDETVNTVVDSMVENLDAYLDYVVAEWMEENKVAIEAGIKVEMAESLMNSLKTVFYEHNIAIDEETIDVVADLEEQVSALEAKANDAINESIELAEEVKTLRAAVAFNEVAEGLTTSQVERLRTLSEKVVFDDEASYKSNLKTLKESFFKTKAPVIAEETEEMLTEDTAPKKVVSSYDTVNALAAAISSIKVK